MSRVRYDPARHRYTYGARALPGVTAVLGYWRMTQTGGQTAGGAAWFTPEVRARGTAVHAACLAHDLGDDVRLPAAWRGYFDAWLGFLAAVPCRWRRLEHILVDKGRRYCTRVDRVGMVRDRAAVVEIKTGGPDAFHGPQLAGQDLALPGGGVGSPRRRVAVYLAVDGRFRVREYTSAADYLTWDDALDRYEEDHEHDREHRADDLD